MKIRLPRKFKLVTVLALVSLLALSTLGIVFADSQSQQAQAKHGSSGNITAAAPDSLMMKSGHSERGKDDRGRIEKRSGSGTLHGSLTAINTGAGEITMLTRKGDTVTFKVGPDTAFRIGNNKTGVLADIAVGDQAKVNFKGHSPVAAEVRVNIEAKAEGAIQSIDSAGGSLVLSLDGGQTLTLKLVSGTKIEIGDVKATSADLMAGQTVEVKYNARTLEALAVEVE